MPVSQDVLQAKQILSARLLRAGVSAGVVGRARTFSVTAAVAAAGRSVHAVGVGRKIVEGPVTDQECVRLYAIAPYPAIGLGGDSGSLVVHQAKQDAVGLYFAGPPAGDYGYANPIDDVLAALEVAIL